MAGLSKDDPRRIARRKSQAMALLESLTGEAIHTVSNIMRDDKAKDSDRLKASDMLLSYAIGRPRQQANVTVETANPAADILSALRVMGQVNPNADTNILISHDKSGEINKVSVNPVIDVEPSE